MTEGCDGRRESWEWGREKRCQQKEVAVTEQPDEDQEEDGGELDPWREEPIGNLFVSV